jgi:AcrR family transcriptional regulator
METHERNAAMSPRPYNLGRRQESAEQTRARIVEAARELLMASDGFSGFTMEAVARQAGVARMTVYYQFESKVGLLEAVSDDLARRGHMERLAEAFTQPTALAALESFVETFARFWGADRVVTGRLRALAALDADFAQVVRGRDGWRRNAGRALIGRFVAEQGRPPPELIEEATALLFTITSFESFDTLAGPDRTPEAVAPLIFGLARAALSVDDD